MTDENGTRRIVDGMMARRALFLSGEINYSKGGELARRLMLLNMESNEPIKLIIDSGGGETFAALTLCDVIETMLTAPVTGIAIGDCGSAATFIMLYCSKRYSTSHSRFLIHSGTRSKVSIPINQTTSESLEHLLREVKSTEERVLNLYMKRLTPRSWIERHVSDDERRAYVRELINRGDQRFDDWISAEEALGAGLIEGIVTDNIGVFTE